ncbi:uncharacterized protein si:dkey-103g5.4 isoform X1 [Xyrichtys novacula]|uniref:Uncharacterized protein si:dkey-103g5.4 isoform X1 n=1 Tax=Xyrichtys novacula TaxID=13765 RepID=A0AAV1FYY9_XYRNO|nr:uncharacterized protein si:dkey-103g5.4 isoform X1 [Xyrichtys novacula]
MTLLRTCGYRSVMWLMLLSVVYGNNMSQHFQEGQSCRPGFYCPLGSFSPIPCPKGTYRPSAGAASVDSCLKCPPEHYCPRPGLSACLPCGPEAQQPLTGQDTCVCLGEGQHFQTSDGQCQCVLGYRLANNGDACLHKLYDACRDGKTRTQYGDCLDKHQWSLHCKEQVCRSAEDYRGYDVELGLCICREPPGRAACGGLCSTRPATQLQLRCGSNGEIELVLSYDNQVSAISGSLVEMLFKQWDSQGTLQCNSQHNSSRPVYIVLATETGFLGMFNSLPEELQQLFPFQTINLNSNGDPVLLVLGSDSSIIWDFNEVESISHGRESNFSGRKGNKGDISERSETGVLNPTTCLHLGDILLFTVDTRHYPQYDLDNLYNTNSDFDWGAFRKLEEELTLSWTPPSFFSVVFTQPGVYVFTLSSHQHKHMYVRVMPAGGQCYEPGPFFPTLPRYMTRMGISRRRNLLLRPDWLVTGGLVFGAVVILCICVTLLILFREYGWPEKEPIRARYRLLQSAYHMDDYSSKVCTETSDEFWDYEHQVDLEAFSSNTFYSLLLKQSLSVTTRLGQLTTEVKELYQGVLGKLQVLHPRMITEERMGESNDSMRREVEREVVRRKTLASQLVTLLDSQLQVLRREQQAQLRVYSAFTSQLREYMRLLSKLHTSAQPPCEPQQQNLIQRLTSLVDEMGELTSAECQRQGAWGLLGEGTGAKLLCPDTGTVLTKNHIFGPDGSLRACQALHYDSVTGLIRPNTHSHMLLNSSHTMAVPPEFFLHPQTGRVMPIAGNVSYDPASSTLVLTTDTCTGDNRTWDSPLLSFIPYPTSRHSDQPLSSTRLRGLRPGQRLQLGATMADPDTGVPVPILAVTIHPQSGLVYPLGGVHVCPVTRLQQPIQIGYPMLDSRTGNLVLTVGVSLDPVTGGVLPVGGVLLGESFIEPLSGRMMKVGGASTRAGVLLPNAGGYQALLDTKVLAVMFKVLALLKPLTEEWGSDPALQRCQSSERGSGQPDHLLAAAKEIQQAWRKSLHCQLQLQTRLEILLDWAVDLQQHGGALGEMPLTGSDICVPALLGFEYPDPMGSGLSVPVLGCHTDLVSGMVIPLAGTMEDPDGKGLVAIRYGSQTVDPVTGLLAPVVGARLDASRKTVVPVTASYWQMILDQNDSQQLEALQREVCARNTFWQQQRQREEDILSDLDSTLSHYLSKATEATVQWSGRQLREAAVELQDSAQSETQRRAAQQSHLALILPPHVLHILTLGDEEEWDQQRVFHSELISGLEKVDVCMEQLQQDQEKWATQGHSQNPALHTTDTDMRQRELWEQFCSVQTELEAAVDVLRCARHFSQLRSDTAQAVVCGDFWYREYGLVQCSVHRHHVKLVGLLRQRAFPLLQRLNQVLEDKQPASFSPNTCYQFVSGSSTKQVHRLETASRVWTTSLPVVKGLRVFNFCQENKSKQENIKHFSNLDFLSESQPMKEPIHTSISLPKIPEEEWNKLLELSPLFHLLKGVEQQLKSWARGAKLFRGELSDRSQSFVDILEAQWECEGELIPLDSSALNPREFLVYQHGLYLMHTLHNLKLTPTISLQIAASLPNNNYYNNAFRNSFFYQEAEETLFIRRQRLQSVGGFSLLLLHCLSHVKIKDMSSDSSPHFQRLFFKALQAGLGELFLTRLGEPLSGQGTDFCELSHNKEITSGVLHGPFSDSHAASLLHRLHKPSRGLLSEDEVEDLQKKHCETSLFAHLESLLETSETTKRNDEQTG